MRLLYLIIGLSSGVGLFGQTVRISLDGLKNSRTATFIIRESLLLREYSAPLQEFHKLEIKFTKAERDHNLRTVTIAGRVCYGEGTSDCVGLPGVQIFTAKRTRNNRLRRIRILGESSYDTDSFEKIGFFDINVRLKRNESLYFFIDNFYLEEYQLDKLKE